MDFIVEQIAVRIYILIIVVVMLTLGMIFPVSFLRKLVNSVKDLKV